MGGAICATQQDFNDAASLYRKRAETQTTKLTGAELDVLRAIHGAGGEMDSRGIQEALGLAQARMHQLIHGQKGRGGLLEKVPELHSERVQDVDAGERRVIRNIYTSGRFDFLGSYATVVSYGGENDPCILGFLLFYGGSVW